MNKKPYRYVTPKYVTGSDLAIASIFDFQLIDSELDRNSLTVFSVYNMACPFQPPSGPGDMSCGSYNSTGITYYTCTSNIGPMSCIG